MRQALRLIMLCVVLNGAVLSNANAQQDPQTPQWQQVLEAIAEQYEDEDIDLTDLQYWLSHYAEHPLNLNTATREELQHLFILNTKQIESLLLHREEFGDLLNVYELQAVEDFDMQTIRNLLPFVRVSGDPDGLNRGFKSLLTEGKNELALRYGRRLESELGYDSNTFLGEPNSLMLRYNYRYGTFLSYGLVAEKDAGEPFFRSPNPYGFDLYSAYLYYKGGKTLRTFALGDYLFQMGQGLAVWSSFGLGKTAAVMNIARQARGIVPSRSTNEYAFLRGAAATFEAGNWSFTAFASRKKLDANADIDTLSQSVLGFSSLQISGFHRTAAEIADKDAITETLGGGELSFRKGRLNLGVGGVLGSYDVPANRQLQLYNKFQPAERTFANFSLHYSYLLGSIYLFGETALSRNGALATLNGLLTSLHPKLDVALLYRDYSRAYAAPYGLAFGESVSNNNEKGFYSAISYNPSASWAVNAYADFFRFPWLRYLVDAPSAGQEYFVEAVHSPSKRLNLYLRYRLQSKDRNAVGEGDRLARLLPETRQSLRLHVQYEASSAVSLRSRIESSRYRHSTKDFTGFMAYQDVIFKPEKKPFQVNIRYALFDVQDYAARIYTYENELPYTFSIPFFDDEGYRWYVMGQYHLLRGLNLYARIAQTRLLNRPTIGSGLTETNVPRRTEVKMMVRWTF